MIKIIAVEESPSIRNILRMTFPAPEFEFHVLSIGQELMAWLSRFDPDVIFINISHLDKDGVGIVQELNSHEGYRDIPLFLFVGAFDTVDEDRLKELDFMELIREPFDSNGLRDLVLSLTNKVSLPGTLPEEPVSETSVEWQDELIEKVRFVVKTQFEKNEDAIAERVIEKVLRELKYEE